MSGTVQSRKRTTIRQPVITEDRKMKESFATAGQRLASLVQEGDVLNSNFEMAVIECQKCRSPNSSKVNALWGDIDEIVFNFCHLSQEIQRCAVGIDRRSFSQPIDCYDRFLHIAEDLIDQFKASTDAANLRAHTSIDGLRNVAKRVESRREELTKKLKKIRKYRKALRAFAR